MSSPKDNRLTTPSLDRITERVLLLCLFREGGVFPHLKLRGPLDHWAANFGQMGTRLLEYTDEQGAYPEGSF